MISAQVAILIPVYDNQVGLDRSLESLRSAEGEFDVIVVDDGSPDPVSVSAYLRHGSAVYLIRCDANLGIARALNRGLDFISAHGYRYVARLDSGDTVVPHRFKLQSAYLDANAQCAVVSSFVEFVDERGKPLFVHRASTNWEALKGEMHIRNCILHTSVMLRLNAITGHALYDVRCDAAEDYELFLRLAMRNELAVLPDVLTLTTYDPAGISVRRRRAQRISRLRCQIRHFDPFSPHSLLGILRTIVATLVPYPLVISWKCFYYR